MHTSYTTREYLFILRIYFKFLILISHFLLLIRTYNLNVFQDN